MNKKILIIALAMLAMFGTSACGKKENKKPETPQNLEDNVATFLDQIVEGLTFKDSLIIYENGVSTLTATVANETTTDIKMSGIGIKLYDVNDQLLIEIPSYVSEKIEANQEKQLVQTINSDISKAVSIEYTIKR